MIDEAFVIAYFPLYNKFFIDDDGNYDSGILENEITLSEAELTEYVDVDADTITIQLKRHLLNIVKYRGFVRTHGNTEFTEKPQIVKDYEATIEKLKAYKDGTESIDGTSITPESDVVRITAKTRRFNYWFNDDTDDLTSEA